MIAAETTWKEVDCAYLFTLTTAQCMATQDSHQQAERHTNVSAEQLEASLIVMYFVLDGLPNPCRAPPGRSCHFCCMGFLLLGLCFLFARIGGGLGPHQLVITAWGTSQPVHS